MFCNDLILSLMFCERIPLFQPLILRHQLLVQRRRKEPLPNGQLGEAKYFYPAFCAVIMSCKATLKPPPREIGWWVGNLPIAKLPAIVVGAIRRIATVPRCTMASLLVLE